MMPLLEMGQIISSIHTVWIAGQIVARHTQVGSPNGITHRLEDTMVDTLGSKSIPRIYVHWGAYESGKSRAASNAQFRLQEMGKLVMLIHGWDFTFQKSARDWLRVNVGVPEDRATDRLSTFLPGDKQAVLIIDHADLLVAKYGENDILEAVSELDIPVLMLFSSWERALDMLTKHYGCKLLGDEPGLGRWDSENLAKLYDSFPERIQKKAEPLKAELHQCALLASSPGILQFETYTCDPRGPSMHRAQLINREWINGIRALNGEDMQGVVGRFPDRDYTFHWDVLPASSESCAQVPQPR